MRRISMKRRTYTTNHENKKQKEEENINFVILIILGQRSGPVITILNNEINDHPITRWVQHQQADEYDDDVLSVYVSECVYA